MATIWQDFNYGIRIATRNPIFSLVVILTLALGIGANAAIFSVVNAVLLQPLAYPQSDRLVMLFSAWPGQGIPEQAVRCLTIACIAIRIKPSKAWVAFSMAT